MKTILYLLDIFVTGTNSVSNLKAMFEKKPAENPFPALKKIGSTANPSTKPEEKKIETPAPQSVSNLKSVFEKKITEPAPLVKQCKDILR